MGMGDLMDFADRTSPLGNATADDCAGYVLTLFSDLTRKVTMQNLLSRRGLLEHGHEPAGNEALRERARSGISGYQKQDIDSHRGLSPERFRESFRRNTVHGSGRAHPRSRQENASSNRHIRKRTGSSGLSALISACSCAGKRRTTPAEPATGETAVEQTARRISLSGYYGTWN